jgi:hypothetical protein
MVLGNIIVSFVALSIRKFLMQNWAIFLDGQCMHTMYACCIDNQRKFPI